MLEKLLHKLGYETFYFISYVGQGGMYGSMNMTVRPYITLNNYKDVLEEVNKLTGAEVEVIWISKL